ncbi:GlcG/HbpS family heme-binding protein [Gluconacetobacter tumulicola]|uniref:Heme-binding protein n=1 Tax=Gluconacetobacter tumulicola TaxID=1017177 RepID=A0A7W4P820_9PROT|nr:heme-binding protein [Gluconacetobacter tumulicola]MBB2178933.1 heme-binding protein [Gluconacetobacter tumulicola]
MMKKFLPALTIAVITTWVNMAPAAGAPLARSVSTLSRAGAQFALQAAIRSATQLNAPCAIAIVDRSGGLMAFDRFDNVRAGSPDLALGKARTSALLERPSEETEDNTNKGRTAFVTAGFMALRGGMPLKVGDTVVGAIGVAGVKKENDVRVATDAALAFSKEAIEH